jgi:hypothetical protein
MRYAARKDGNHAEIEAVFRRLLADHVTDSSKWAGGAGDLYVSFGFFGVFIEIKVDEKAEFTAAQIRFQRDHPNMVWRCETVDQAIHQCKCIRANAARLVIEQ